MNVSRHQQGWIRNTDQSSWVIIPFARPDEEDKEDRRLTADRQRCAGSASFLRAKSYFSTCGLNCRIHSSAVQATGRSGEVYVSEIGTKSLHRPWSRSELGYIQSSLRPSANSADDKAAVQGSEAICSVHPHDESLGYGINRTGATMYIIISHCCLKSRLQGSGGACILTCSLRPSARWPSLDRISAALLKRSA